MPELQVPAELMATYGTPFGNEWYQRQLVSSPRKGQVLIEFVWFLAPERHSERAELVLTWVL